MKRVFDLVIALLGLVVFSPVLILAAVLVKLDSPGPVFFRQKRIGKGFQPFFIYKFRTMVYDAPHKGGAITVGADPRITRLGRILRKSKVDELPQLFNILRGEMSFVGPRPEVPQYVELFRQDYEEILQILPGVTDLSSLKYRNEAEILQHAENPEEEYVAHVLPDKIKLAREYLLWSSFFFDLRMIFKTVLALVRDRVDDLSLPGELRRTTDVIIQRHTGLFHLDLTTVWHYRELLYFLIWRDVKVRYKQTLIGAGWAILQPLMTMVIFTIVFGNFAKIPSDGVPYPIFAYTALLPWNFFAQALSRSGNSLVGSANLITKVYFPRLIMPLAAAVAPIVDFAIALVILLGMMIWFGIVPTWGILALPLFLFLSLVTALSVGLWLSALHVRYRDVGYIIPFLIQFWMYASPVVYPVSLVPEKWRLLYSLNPIVGVIEGFRWALLNTGNPDFGTMAVSGVTVIGLLLGGVVYFGQMERTFADVV
jgi:homopolymeric O-antigen transport system permease protein